MGELHIAHQLDTILEEGSSLAASDDGKDSELCGSLTRRSVFSTLRRPKFAPNLREMFTDKPDIKISPNLRLKFAAEPETDVEICEATALVHTQVGQAKKVDIIKRKPVKSQAAPRAQDQRAFGKSPRISSISTLAAEVAMKRFQIDGAFRLDLPPQMQPPTIPAIYRRTRNDGGIPTAPSCKYCKRFWCPACPPVTKTTYVDMAMSKNTVQEFVKFNATCEHKLCTRTTDVTYFRCSRWQHGECDTCTESMTYRVVFAKKPDGGEDLTKIVAKKQQPETFCVCCKFKCVGEGSGWEKVS
jgi:hypothetical protein